MSSSLTGAFGGGFRRAADAEDTSSNGSAWRTRLADLWWVGLFAGSLWLALAGLTLVLPENGDFPYSATFGHGAGLIGAGLLLASPLLPALGRVGDRLRHWGPWIVALAFAFIAWELVTAKLEWLPMPFFPPPQAILEVF
ncbi:MAG: ABC transporter permease, partial [Methylobacterium sp.]|nr:ABC transporter permease [Methylobacterium sp.]